MRQPCGGSQGTQDGSGASRRSHQFSVLAPVNRRSVLGPAVRLRSDTSSLTGSSCLLCIVARVGCQLGNPQSPAPIGSYSAAASTESWCGVIASSYGLDATQWGVRSAVLAIGQGRRFDLLRRNTLSTLRKCAANQVRRFTRVVGEMG